MKNLLSFRTKFRALLFLQRFRKLVFFKDVAIDPKKKQAYIFLAADYGNLGDVAITYAQTYFLKENTDYQVIEIPISKSLEGLWFVKKNIREGDLVTTVGGGNMGELYDQIEFIRQCVIQFFPDNKIISFPQTFDFTETEEGRRALARAKKIYNSHKNLVVVAREETSYQLMKKHFHKAKVLLTPDIVLSLDKRKPERKRKGAVICLRKDAEKFLSEEENERLIQMVHEHFDEVIYYDTHINRSHLSIKEREEELKKIWDVFKGAELVVTDRLHGMIFCHITGTPALVFQNNNHKVRETYEWISDNKVISLMESFDLAKLKSYFEKDTPLFQAVDLERKYSCIIEEAK